MFYNTGTAPIGYQTPLVRGLASLPDTHVMPPPPEHGSDSVVSIVPVLLGNETPPNSPLPGFPSSNHTLGITALLIVQYSLQLTIMAITRFLPLKPNLSLF